jgi:hypothetical protein
MNALTFLRFWHLFLRKVRVGVGSIKKLHVILPTPDQCLLIRPICGVTHELVWCLIFVLELIPPVGPSKAVCQRWNDWIL